MADQEFLASFGVDIDESGLDRLQKALKENRTLAEQLASAPAAAAPVIQQTSNSSVQAPVSINVTAAGTDPEAVGKSIYDVAERYLLRTLEQASC